MMTGPGSFKGWFAPAALAASAHVGLALIPISLSAAQAKSHPPALHMSLVQAEPAAEPPAPALPTPPVHTEALPPEPVRQAPVPPRPLPIDPAHLVTESPIAVAEQLPAEETDAPENTASEVPPTETTPAIATPVQPTLPAPKAEPVVKTKQAPKVAEPVEIDWNGYQRDLFRSIAAERRYPPMARRLGLEGVARVRFVLSKTGRLAAPPQLAKSSGHTLLDEEALEMAKRASFAPLPAGAQNDQVVFVIPVRFTLPK